MSDTPVTNLNTWTTICGNLKGAHSENEDELYVPVSVSQKLERKLNAANERIKRLEEAGDAMMFWCADEVSLEQWNFAKQ